MATSNKENLVHSVLHPRHLNLLPLCFQESNEETLNVVFFRPNTDLERLSTPHDIILDVVISAFDCLKPYEQLMLKCGSVLSLKFSRQMLNAIIRFPDDLLTALGLLYE